MSTPLKTHSTQIVAGVAVVMALLGGAYAVGRSQSGESLSPAQMQSQQLASADAAREATRDATRDATRESARVVREQPPARTAPAAVEEAPRMACDNCARVTDVHTEARQGKASGVGVVGGAVVGGLLGNMVGGGNGKKLATVAGAVGGGYAGNEIEKNQKTTTVWVVQVREGDGRTHRFERSSDPGLRVGDEVRLTENGFSRG